MREAERGLLNSSYTAPSAADDVEAPRPESPSPARPVDALSLFLPGGGRGGNEPQGRRWWVWTVVFITVFALALGGVATGVVCFASDGRIACPTCAKDKQGGCLPNPKLAKLNANYWSLLNTLVLLAALPVAAWSGAEVAGRALARRRVARLKRRVSKELAGVTTRAEAQEKLMDGLRDAMRVVHDDSLRVRLSFDGLSYKLRDGTRVLSDASGEVRPHEVTAIMGPSGCGKSTLLGLLSGKLTPSGGSLRINGARLKVSQISKLVAFVPQDDVMLTALTVDELLRFSAQIRLPRDVPRAQLDGWVRTVIDLLGLTQQRHSVVGDATRRGLSGGQRKRVNIGLEVVADPSLIFLDEPTSGLDSTAALELSAALGRLASYGVAVCAVIHQPRQALFEKLDRLILLSPNGRTVYVGPSAAAAAHFEALGFAFAPNENAADQLLDVVSGAKESSGVPVDELAAKWNEFRLASPPGPRPTERTGTPPGMAAATGSASELPVPTTPPPRRGAPPVPTTANGGRAEDEETQLERRLTDHGGRRTAGRCRQLVLFSGRSATQLLREGPTVLRNLLLVCLAGVLLGLLYEGQYEKTRCDHLADGLAKAPLLPAPPTPDEKQQWIAGCKVQAAEGGSFSRSRFFCFGGGDDAAALGVQTADHDEFHELSLQYTQAFTLSLLALAIISIQTALNAFGAERAVFWRESRHYSIWAYCVGKNVAALPLSLFYPFAFLSLFLPLLRPFTPFHSLYFTFALVHWAGEGLGQLISLHLNSSRQLAGGVAALLCTVLTGSFPMLDTLPQGIKYLSYASFVRWGMEGLVALEFDPWAYGDAWHGNGTRVPDTCCRFDLDPAVNFTTFWSTAVPPYPACPVNATRYPWVPPPKPTSKASVVDDLVNRFGYKKYGGHMEPDLSATEWGSPFCLAMLAILGVVFRILVLISLQLKDRQQRR